MSGPLDLTNVFIEDTYQRLIQTDGVYLYDGTGSLFSISGSSSGIAILNNTNNNILTATGNSASINGESRFTFDGFNAVLTGSFNVTGSTTQIGNNTLLGNTLLSGSITISGSSGPGSTTASVQIYGDIRQSGYHRFDPVTTNIDTSTSASYIYVSGSTNDLYFSQNGNGYTNVTRLRWLEGNLYTGLLHGGLISQLTTTTYQVGSGSGIIVDLNTSVGDDPYPTIQFLNWGNLSASIAPLTASYDQQFVAINSSNQIFAQGIPYNNGDYNEKIPIGIVLHQNRSTINGVQTFPGVAYGWKQRSFDFIKAFGGLKISGYTLSQSGSSTRGLLLSGGTAWVDGRNYTIDPTMPSYIEEAIGTTTSKIFRYYQSGSNWESNWGYNTNGGVGFTDIDPTQYSNAGTLTPVSTNNFTIQRVFYFPNSATKALFVYYGNAEYANEAAAFAAVDTETFAEAPNTLASAIYIGFMLLRHNANFNTLASYKFYSAGLFRGSGAGGGGGGGTTSPGGSNTQIQYNNAGAFGGVTNLTWDGTTLRATGSFTGSFTGSLFGTASYALNGGVTQLLAGSNITLSPTNGKGQVTISSTGGGSGTGNTSTGSYGSFYSTATQTNPVINVLHSMSLNTTDISNGVSISGSTNPYDTYIKMETGGVYDIQFSAQIEKTSPGGTNITYIWLRKNGIDLAETNTAFELSQNGKGVAAWNWFVNAAANDYYQIMWSSNATDTQLTAETPLYGPAVPSVIVTANRVDQLLSNTGSFSGSFTGTLIGSASFATTSSYSNFSNVAYNVATLNQNVIINGNLSITGNNKIYIENGASTPSPGISSYSDPTTQLTTAGNFNGETIKGVAGENLDSGEIIYLNTDGLWYKADATPVTGDYSAINLLGVLINTGAANQNDNIVVLLQGHVYTNSIISGDTPGTPLWLNTTAGTARSSKPNSTNNVVRQVGHVLTSGVIRFNPDNYFSIVP